MSREGCVNELIKGDDKRMTVKEVAEALGYQPDTIQGKVKELFPELVKNGIATLLTMEEVDTIKQNLVPRSLGLKSEVEKAVTSIDIERMTLQVIQYHAARVKELESELAAAAPKVGSFDRFLDASGSLCIQDTAKQLGHRPNKFFDELAAKGIIYRRGGDWLPRDAYIIRGWFEVKTRTYGEPPNEHITKQTRVTSKGLDSLAKLFPVSGQVSA
jgi:phage antirepressor YoqD-like protein